MPNNDMGKVENITNATFEKAGKVMNQSAHESMESTKALLEKVLAAGEVPTDKDWKP